MACPRNSCSGKRSRFQIDDYLENGSNKRRYSGDGRDRSASVPDYTVYHYLFPGRKIGCIIGKSGDIVKQLRQESQSKIMISDNVPGCEERVVTIFSSSKETNSLEGFDNNRVCPALDALFKVHDKLVADIGLPGDDAEGGWSPVTVRLLVPSDQIGCIIGKGGQIIENMSKETAAQIRILKNDHFLLCAMSNDYVLQMTGKSSIVKKVLHQVASRLHDNPSRLQHPLSSSTSKTHQSGGAFTGPNAGNPIVGMTPLLGSYGGNKGDPGVEWPSSLYYPRRKETSPMEFSLRLVCHSSSIGGVIGKGGGIIKQIRQDSGAFIKVVTPTREEDERIISISAIERFEDPISPTIDAAVRLQSRCSEKTKRENGEYSYMTRLLVPTACIGCLIGKGGSIIDDMRRVTRANIRIFSKDNHLKFSSQDDELVQIGGDIESAMNALVQVATRLKANVFEREGSLPSLFSDVTYLPPRAHREIIEDPKYGVRDRRSFDRGSIYSCGRGGLHHSDSYGVHGGSKGGGGGCSNRSGSRCAELEGSPPKDNASTNFTGCQVSAWCR